MNIESNLEFQDDSHLMIWRPRGLLNEAAVNQCLIELVRREMKAPRPFHRFSDLSAVESFDLTFKYVFHIALYRRLSYSGREPVKSAFYVTEADAAHLVKIHAVMTDNSPLCVEMFEEREAAAEWLEVPVELLMPTGG